MNESDLLSSAQHRCFSNAKKLNFIVKCLHLFYTCMPVFFLGTSDAKLGSLTVADFFIECHDHHEQEGTTKRSHYIKSTFFYYMLEDANKLLLLNHTIA